MTLIISDISKLGVSMVADTALLYPNGSVLLDCTKLQPIPALNAGISMWGLGELTTSSGVRRTDEWVADFLSANADATSLGDLADRLAAKMRVLVGPSIRDESSPGRLLNALGFHLVGYQSSGGERVPMIYHVRNMNQRSDGSFEPYNFKGQPEKPLGYLPTRTGNTWRNGDFLRYGALADATASAMSGALSGLGFTIPSPALGLPGRLLYNAAWVRFMADLYVCGSLKPSIGSRVIGLNITLDETGFAYDFEGEGMDLASSTSAF